MTTREELIEKAVEVGAVAMNSGRERLAADRWGPEVRTVVGALADAGLLADPEQAAELAEAQRSAKFWQGQAEQWERDHQATVLPYTSKLEARLAFGLKLIDDQMALFGSVMAESQAGILRDIRAALTGEVTLDD